MNIQIIIVTYNRKYLLRRCLNNIINGSLKDFSLCIIDNASIDDTYQLVQEEFLNKYNIDYKLMSNNIGGAGGFHEGIKYALEQGAEYIWMMDDDGYPDELCLEKLYITLIDKKMEAISPLQININQQDKLAFPVWLNKKQIRGHLSQICQEEFLYQEANLFNGLLIHRSVVEKVGLPCKELFIRGDEVEYTKRLLKNNIKFGTLTSAKFYHPSDDNERVSMLAGLVTTRDAHSDFKNYYMFRNRAVAFIEDGNAWLLPLDFIRYSYYFMIYKKWNWKGLKLWCTATYDGINGKLGRHPKY